jgi:ribosomal protein S18 acetylase RimI-like enzyme
MADITIVPFGEAQRDWATALLTASWGATVVVSRGQRHDAAQLPGFVALQGGTPVGLATYDIVGDDCELVSLNSIVDGAGIGTALIAPVRDVAISAGCRRVWLITTNDNLDALRFYQRRGFVLVAVHRNAVTEARRQKPQIPLIGDHGIPLRDEIELELPIRIDD